MEPKYTPFSGAAEVALQPFLLLLNRGSAFASDLQPVIGLVLSCIIMWRAYQIILSKQPGNVIQDVAGKTAKVVVCIGLAGFAGSHYIYLDGVTVEYQTYFAQLLTTGADGVAPYTLGNEVDLFKTIDQSIQPFLTKLHDVSNHGLGKDNLDLQASSIMGLLVLGSATFSSSAALAFAASIGLMLLYFRVALIVCVFTAPLFIIFLAFPVTSRMFYSWLSTATSYTLAAGVAAIPVGIAIDQLKAMGIAFAHAVDNTGVGGEKGMDFLVAPLMAALSMSLLAYLSMRLPPLVGKLVGGMVAPPSMGEGQQLIRAPQAMAAQFNQAGKALAGQQPRGPNGQFIARSGQTPLQQLNQGTNWAISNAQRLTDQTVRALGGTPLSRGSSASNRAPQQSVADRRRADATLAQQPPQASAQGANPASATGAQQAKKRSGASG